MDESSRPSPESKPFGSKLWGKLIMKRQFYQNFRIKKHVSIRFKVISKETDQSLEDAERAEHLLLRGYKVLL